MQKSFQQCVTDSLSYPPARLSPGVIVTTEVWTYLIKLSPLNGSGVGRGVR